MRFEWDLEKARTNRSKHGVSFEFATRVWEDEHIQFAPDQVVAGEERWRAIGHADAFTLLVVIHIDVEQDTIRIISARRATPTERRRHEQETV